MIIIHREDAHLIEHHAVDNYPFEQGVSERIVGSPPLRVSDAMEQVAKGEGTAEQQQFVAAFKSAHERCDFAIVAVRIDDVDWTPLRLANVKAQVDGMFRV